MKSSTNLVDLAPAVQLLAGAALAAAVVLGWLAWRRRGQGASAWLAALTALTVVLTFDLVVFGSFTRLTDSGLGCPDWPGCYGQASPVGAARQIAAEEAAMPTGPVTHSKAWIEMIHRYLAMTVGGLILVLAVASWIRRRELPHSPWWATATLVWVVIQGLFGKYTVTLKLYPAIVTLHLLGGQFLLALLVVQYERWQQRPLALTDGTRGLLLAAVAALWIQCLLGGWVSTNYAVLACSGFPQCNGQWWPQDMEFEQAFSAFRHLGQTTDGQLLGLPSLVAIHVVHRAFAVIALGLLAFVAWRLWQERQAIGHRPAAWVGGLAAAQLASGLSNVVLGWPLAAALMHSAGAAALVAVGTSLMARSHRYHPAGVGVRGRPDPHAA